MRDDDHRCRKEPGAPDHHQHEQLLHQRIAFIRDRLVHAVEQLQISGPTMHGALAARRTQFLHVTSGLRADSASTCTRQNSCYRFGTIVLVSTHTFLKRVATRTRLSPDSCGQLVELTIKTIAAHLDADTRGQLIDNLPPTLAVWAESANGTAHGLRTLRAAGLSAEHVAVMCGFLAEMIPVELCEALRIELPPELAELLIPTTELPA